MIKNGKYLIQTSNGVFEKNVGSGIHCDSIDDAVNYVLANDFIPVTECTHNVYYIGEENAIIPAYLYFTFFESSNKYYLNVECHKFNTQNKYEITEVDNKWSLVQN